MCTDIDLGIAVGIDVELHPVSRAFRDNLVGLDEELCRPRLRDALVGNDLGTVSAVLTHHNLGAVGSTLHIDAVLC